MQVTVLVDHQHIPLLAGAHAVFHALAHQIAVIIIVMIIGVDGKHRVIGRGHRFAGHRAAGIVLIGHGRADLAGIGNLDNRVHIVGFVDAALADIHRQGRVLIVGIGGIVLLGRRLSNLLQRQGLHFRQRRQAAQQQRQRGQRRQRAPGGICQLHCVIPPMRW